MRLSVACVTSARNNCLVLIRRSRCCFPKPTPTSTSTSKTNPALRRRMASASPSVAAAAAPPDDAGPSADFLKSWDEKASVSFGPHPIPRTTVFATSPLSFAFVNLRPVVPGHVLVSSKRPAPRFSDLSTEEASDLWLLARRVGSVLEAREREATKAATALTFALQDGPAAGQSVPHVHVHVIPRGGPGDRFAGEERNDDLYPELQRAGRELDGDLKSVASTSSAAPDPFARERKDRTLEEMEREAAALRELF